jgi:hypothetical protein
LEIFEGWHGRCLSGGMRDGWQTALATGALLLMACGGAVAPTTAEDTGANGGASIGAPSPAPQPIALPPTAPAATPETPTASAARAALAGRSFHAIELHVGGYPFGTAPTNYREAIVGEMMKVCFGTVDALTVCECDHPVFASVYDIGQGGHPSDHCNGPLVCRGGTYRFNDAGRLRLDVPNTTLTWPLRTDGAQPEAGEVAVRPEGTYVRSLIGLGDVLLAPTEGCP